MFRKLFISLLILSALTSDGSVNIAEYLINPHLYIDASLDLFIVDCEPSLVEVNTLNDGKDVNGPAFFSNTFYKKYAFPEDNGHSIRPGALYGDYNFNLYISFPQGFDVKESDSFVSKDIRLCMSDSSPPHA